MFFRSQKKSWDPASPAFKVALRCLRTEARELSSSINAIEVSDKPELRALEMGPTSRELAYFAAEANACVIILCRRIISQMTARIVKITEETHLPSYDHIVSDGSFNKTMAKTI